MRFLADAGLSPATVDFLIQLGHEAVHVRTLGMQRAPDADVVARARADSSVVLTFDLDFGDVLALGVLDKPSVVIFRLSDERPESVNRRPRRCPQRMCCGSRSGRADFGRGHALPRTEIADWASGSILKES